MVGHVRGMLGPSAPASEGPCRPPASRPRPTIARSWGPAIPRKVTCFCPYTAIYIILTTSDPARGWLIFFFCARAESTARVLAHLLDKRASTGSGLLLGTRAHRIAHGCHRSAPVRPSRSSLISYGELWPARPASGQRASSHTPNRLVKNVSPRGMVPSWCAGASVSALKVREIGPGV